MNNFNNINFKTAYLRRSINTLSELIVTCIVSTVITAILFFMSSWLWTIYDHTNIGEAFSYTYPVLAGDINNAFRPWCIEIAIYSNTVSLIALLLLGASSQLLHVQRFFYESMGNGLRIIVWGGGTSIFVSLLLGNQYGINSFEVSYACAIPSTIMILGKAFAFTSTAVPEFGEIINKIISQFSGSITEAKAKISKQLEQALSAIEETNKK